MPHDPRLADRMREALQTRDGIVEKTMFGGPCWMLRGNLLCTAEVGRYMFRVGKAQEAEALRRGALPMEITKRPMGGIVWVREQDAQGAALEGWIALADNFVGSLPAK